MAEAIPRSSPVTTGFPRSEGFTATSHDAKNALASMWSIAFGNELVISMTAFGTAANGELLCSRDPASRSTYMNTSSSPPSPRLESHPLSAVFINVRFNIYG